MSVQMGNAVLRVPGLSGVHALIYAEEEPRQGPEHLMVYADLRWLESRQGSAIQSLAVRTQSGERGVSAVQSVPVDSRLEGEMEQVPDVLLQAVVL